MMNRPGRNDPCWCGSGKKYKHCHMAFDDRLIAERDLGHEVPDHSLIKTPAQIEKIKESCKINIAVLDYVAEHIRAGVTTEEIDQWVFTETQKRGGIPADLNYEGYPKSVCTSVNEQVCHGIPSPDVVLKDGDIINVDCSTILDGYFSDSSRMFCIGNVSPEKKRLVEVTREAVAKGLEALSPGDFSATWPKPSIPTLRRTATALSGRSAATASACSFMRIPGSAISENAAPACCWFPA